MSGRGEAGRRPFVLTAAARRQRTLGEQLAEIDRVLLARLQDECQALLRRALERAGAKVRRKLGGEASVLRDVAQSQVLAFLGPQRVEQLGLEESDLIGDSLDEVTSIYDELVGAAQARVRQLGGTLYDEDDPLDVDAVKAKQDDDRAAGAALLAAALAALARQRLYDPHPAVTDGEMPRQMTVPASTVREALQRAGGGSGTDQVRRGREPEGMVATGRTAMDVFREAGIVRVGWRWVYGDPSTREAPFDPHLDLDGLEFRSWDDPQLANGWGWPPVEFFYPGDHIWCQCDFEPVMAEPDGDTADLED